MKWAILSIPHTGTHFVLDLLGGSVPKLKEQMNIPYEQNGNSYYVSHSYRLTIFEIMEDQGYEIVCPMRHPITTIISWANWQARQPVDLNAVVGGDNLPDVWQYFEPDFVPKLYRGIITANQLYNINFLPIDSEYRQDYLDCFNRKYNLNITTQWKPLNSIGEHDEQVPERLIDEVEHLTKSNPEFFGMFY
jgi:hypothetical protein